MTDLVSLPVIYLYLVFAFKSTTKVFFLLRTTRVFLLFTGGMRGWARKLKILRTDSFVNLSFIFNTICHKFIVDIKKDIMFFTFVTIPLPIYLILSLYYDFDICQNITSIINGVCQPGTYCASLTYLGEYAPKGRRRRWRFCRFS